jgi:hypothetical protein
MAKKVFGLASLKIADIASDGGMGTSLTTIGETVSGTAVMAQEDNTTTDFTIEESSSPIESIVSAEGKITFAWSSYNISYQNLKKLFGGTGSYKQANGTILTLGSITAGTGYTNGFYENVVLTGGAGGGTARANITISGGGVTAVEVIDGGAGYAAANNLSVTAASVGGTGSGFQVPVATVASVAADENWAAPDSFPDVERSLEIIDTKGNKLLIPRAKIAAKLGLSFAKDKLGQLDMVATVLQPTKSGEKRLTLSLKN